MKVLIVKLSSLGDVIQTMPVVADILAVYPDAQIDWVVEEAFAPLTLRVQGLRRVMPIALRRWKKSWLSRATRQERTTFKQQLQADAYDAVIDCQGLTKSALVARMAKLNPQGLRGSFANKSDACSYEWPVQYLLTDNQPMPQRIHAIARTRLLAAQLLGYVPTGSPRVVFMDLPVRAGLSRQIMFTHGTTRADNEWPQWKWESVAAQLARHDQHQILLPHANDKELAICQGIQRYAGKLVQVLPRMGLPELLNIMSTCQGVIGVDSGLSHMAVALGLPHVQLFSHDRAWRAGPVDTPHQLAIGGAVSPSVQDVMQAWHKVVIANCKQVAA
ncbi:MAG: lipopolysaccharide heptosyltransferase I [Cytophagales bacterium]|nr:lipopolysaccharide heptosyltransferase I [Cytophagales bacterium]